MGRKEDRKRIFSSEYGNDDIEKTRILIQSIREKFYTEKFGSKSFLELWNELGYGKKLRIYEDSFLHRLEQSTDEKILFNLEIERVECTIEFLKTWKHLPKQIGYLIGGNGQNPKVSDLLLGRAGYHFIAYHDEKTYCIIEKEIIEQSKIVITKLPDVCEGYLRAKQVEFLRGKEREINTPNFENRTESLPEYQFKTNTQKIAWLHELGILQPILKRANDNYYIAANIIHSFTDLKPDTIRKALEAMYKPNEKNKKNNPLNNSDNLLFIAQMKRKFKLDKEKED